MKMIAAARPPTATKISPKSTPKERKHGTKNQHLYSAGSYASTLSLVAARRRGGVGAAGVRNLVDLLNLDRGLRARGTRGAGTRRTRCAGIGGAGVARGRAARCAGPVCFTTVRVGYGAGHGDFLSDMLVQLRSIGAGRNDEVIGHTGFVDNREFAGGTVQTTLD